MCLKTPVIYLRCSLCGALSYEPCRSKKNKAETNLWDLPDLQWSGKTMKGFHSVRIKARDEHDRQLTRRSRYHA